MTTTATAADVVTPQESSAASSSPFGDLIAQAAESKIYVSTSPPPQQQQQPTATTPPTEVIIKHRFPKAYRHPTLDQKLREERTTREARALARCWRYGVATPAVLRVDKHQATITMECIAGTTVRDALHRTHKQYQEGLKQQQQQPQQPSQDQEQESKKRKIESSSSGSSTSSGSASNQQQAAFIAYCTSLIESIGAVIGALHQGDIIHGDLTTSNFMLSDGPSAAYEEFEKKLASSSGATPSDPAQQQQQQQGAATASKAQQQKEKQSAQSDAALVRILRLLRQQQHQISTTISDSNNNNEDENAAPPPPPIIRLVMIDFGLVRDSTNAEERAVDLYVLERVFVAIHPYLEFLGVSEVLERGYSRIIDPVKGKQTLDRLAAVRSRGRKRTMIG